MLQALSESGIRPDLLIGTSVGALNAAWFAGRPEASGLQELAGIWGAIRTRDIFPVSPATAIRGVFGRGNNLVDRGPLQALLSRHLAFQDLEDGALPIHVVATEILTGRGRLLSKGPAIPALLASCAVPGVYPPVRLDRRDYVDGGVSDNTPISHALDMGATILYVLPSGYACALRRPPRSVPAMALHALTLLLQRQRIAEVARLEDRAEIHVVPPLCPLGVSPADFSHSGELISRAARSTRRWLRCGLPARDQTRLLALHGFHGQAQAVAAESGPESDAPPA
jgi:NTE family protein